MACRGLAVPNLRGLFVIRRTLRNRLSPATLERLRGVGRVAAERLGVDRWSRPSLEGIEDDLDALFEGRAGVFVEAGANDGLRQSNTYFLERMRSWTGVLVEPVPRLAEACRRNRPRAHVVNCALVAFGFGETSIEMDDVDLMSVVDGALGSYEQRAEHIRRGESVQRVTSQRVLSDVLDEAGVRNVDLLSLDVEGYEVEVLKGLDLDRHAPRYLLIEVREPEPIEAALGNRYRRLRQITTRDVLYQRLDHTDQASGSDAGRAS